MQSPIPDNVTFSLTPDPSQSVLSAKGHFVLLKARQGNVSVRFVPDIVGYIDRIEALADRKSLGLIEDEHICLRGVYINDTTGHLILYIDHLQPHDTGAVTKLEEIEALFPEDYLEVRVRSLHGVRSGNHVFRNAPDYYTGLHKKLNWVS